MKNILFSLLCTLFLFTGCSNDDERSETATYLRIPENVKAVHYLKDVQRDNIKIETNDPDWTITSDKDWCDVHRISRPQCHLILASRRHLSDANAGFPQDFPATRSRKTFFDSSRWGRQYSFHYFLH